MNINDWFHHLKDSRYKEAAIYDHWFKGELEFLKRPEISFMYLTKYIPEYINNVLVIGCGSGKDFLTFDVNYYLFGIDISPAADIHWVKAFKDLTYKCLSVEDFTQELKRADVDMRDTLVISQGVLMYVAAEGQQEFYATCVLKGCKNFIFSEYSTYTMKHGDKCLHLGPHIVDFLVKSYRNGYPKPEQPNAHIRLDVPPEVAGKLFEEFIPENVQKTLTPKDHARELIAAIRFKMLKALRLRK